MTKIQKEAVVAMARAKHVKPAKIGGAYIITLNGEVYFEGRLGEREALRLLLLALKITKQTATIRHNVYRYVATIEVAAGEPDFAEEIY